VNITKRYDTSENQLVDLTVVIRRIFDKKVIRASLGSRIDAYRNMASWAEEGDFMKNAISYTARAVLSGMFILLPLYLAVLLMIKAAGSVAKVVQPLALLLPDWLPAELALSVILVLFICFIVGISVRTKVGHDLRDRFERSFFERIPGYALIRSLIQQIAGSGSDDVWKPALVESAQGLLPAFIIEEFEDGRYTIFVPSIPTPLAGAVYVSNPSLVHPLDIPFTDALRTISKWGLGAKDLVAAMEDPNKAKLAASVAPATREVAAS
jgi:uncharacterized membrane protein